MDTKDYFNEFDITLTDDKVLNFIEVLKGTNESTRQLMEEIYMEGDCGRFHLMIRTAFPEAEAYVFKGRYPLHVLTKVGDTFYDVLGVATKDRFDHLKDYCEVLEQCDTLEEALVKVNVEDLFEIDMFNNYSFEVRGPIL